MTQLPTSLDEAVEQAKQATVAALEAGYSLLQVELIFPEIDLKAQSIAAEFIPALEKPDIQLKVFFPDTGAAALARRDWGETDFRVTDLGTNLSAIETRLAEDDGQFLVIAPSPVEVAQVEKLSQLAADRPVILLNPRLEDIAIVGIGYAARQLRERFIQTIESCYYLKPLESGALFRCYPSPWEVWQEVEGQYHCLAQEDTKPNADRLDEILTGVGLDPKTASGAIAPQRRGLLQGLQNFLNALSR
ncbi:MAG: DUF1995 family protein [Oscillatoriales cyanobacterium RM1_1_9]|nr:DUF1995 family protein [Oscillatoriales cyanobacterium SM2_3_0]NJO45608.1 DUF1995 family protein [Oscillatoriales cyanobacterium RM2_1_1]NJO70885.1 DUF1995 family protein [Oscillatoriales cyanobacterium RM1_1_9]